MGDRNGCLLYTPATDEAPAERRRRFTRGGRMGLRATSALTAAALATASLAPAHALPQGGTVVEGDAIIEYGTDSVVITQGSANVIIEWSSFDVAAHESVHFDQVAFMAALNRVLSGEASAILGSLTGAGSITLVNAAGIAFGATANVDVGAITATTLDILNANFMANRLTFDQYDAAFATASVTNAGTITVADQGLAALVGPGVANSGLIQARSGAVALASGTAYTVDFYGDGLINFAVTGATQAAPMDADGTPLGALVSNSGQIYADGGTVILAAEAVGGIVDNAINMDGVIQARTVEGRKGQIALVAGAGAGQVLVAGSLDASGAGAGTTGGTVHVLGDAVGLMAGADVDVSGAAGGGEVLVGGAYLGGANDAGAALHYARVGGVTTIVADAGFAAGGYVPTAEIAYFDAAASVNASATDGGDGGKVIVWADRATVFHGAITASAGAGGGDGGFVETSGKVYLQATGSVLASAANGAAGVWLLDPRNLEITGSITNNISVVGGLNPTIFTAIGSSGGVDGATSELSAVSIEWALDSGTSVTLRTSDQDDGAGTITFNGAITKTAGGNATLRVESHDDIIINLPIISVVGQLNVYLSAGEFEGGTPAPGDDNDISVRASISTNGGSVTMVADREINTMGLSSGVITTGGGDVSMTALGSAGATGGNILYHSNISTGGGSLTMSASDDIRIRGTLTTAGGNASFAALAQNLLAADLSEVQFTVSSGITGSISTAGGDVSIIAEELILQASAGTQINAGTGTVLIDRPGLSRGTVSIGAGAAAASATNMQITQTELARITAAQLAVGGSSGNSITGISVNGANATTATISGLVTLRALDTVGNTVDPLITFDGVNVFNSLAATSNGDITVGAGASITAQQAGGTLALSAFDDITIGENATVLRTTVGSIVLASDKDNAGGLITIDGDVTITGAGAANNLISLQARSIVIDDDGDTITSNNGDIWLLTDSLDIDETGAATPALAAGLGEVVIGRLTAGTVGLGLGAAGQLHLSQGEIYQIDAAELIIGDPDNGSTNDIGGHSNQISAINVLSADFTNFGGPIGIERLVSLYALNGNADIILSGNSIAPQLRAQASNRVVVNAPGNNNFALISSFGTIHLIGGASGGLSPGITIAGSLLAGDFRADAFEIDLSADIDALLGISGSAFIVNVSNPASVPNPQGARINHALALISHAASPAQPGTVNVGNGVWTEAVVVTKNNVILKGPGATIQPASPGFTINAIGVTIDGFSYAGTGGDPAILLTGAADDIIIKNGSITGTTGAGAGIRAAAGVTASLDLLVQNVTMTGVDGHGIEFLNNLDIADIDVVGGSISSKLDGIHFAGTVLGNSRIDIDGVTIDAGGDGIAFADFVGDTSFVDIAFFNVISAGNRGINFGSDVGGSAQVYIGGNAIDAVSHGVQVTGIVGSAGVTVEANTIGDLAAVGGNGVNIGAAIENTSRLLVRSNDVLTAQHGVRVGGVVTTTATTLGGFGVLIDLNAITANAGDGVAFATLVTGAAIGIVDNPLIDAGGRGIALLGDVIDSTIAVTGNNAGIFADDDGLLFGGAVVASVIDIHDNIIQANQDRDLVGSGILFAGAISDSTVRIGDGGLLADPSNFISVLTDLGGGSADLLDGIRFGNALTGTSQVTIKGNRIGFTATDLADPAPGEVPVAGDGIALSSSVMNGAVLTIEQNVVRAEEGGILIAGAILNNAVVNIGVAGGGNDVRSGGDAFHVGSTITDSTALTVFDNLLQAGLGVGNRGIELEGGIAGSAIVLILGNGIEAGDDGIMVAGGISGGAFVLVQANTIGGLGPVGTTTGEVGAGIDIAQIVDSASVGIDFNFINAQGTGIQVDNPISTNSLLFDGGTFGVLISNNTIVATDLDGIELAGSVVSAAVGIRGNPMIFAGRDGIRLAGPLLGTTYVSISRNGSAQIGPGGAFYFGPEEVDLDDFIVNTAITGLTGSGINVLNTLGSATLEIDQNIVADSMQGMTFGNMLSTTDALIFNNFVLGSIGDAVQFTGFVDNADVKLFQNYLADSGGSAIHLANTANILNGHLIARLNFMPGAAFDHGNLGFGFDHDGLGVADIEFNWWGSAFLAGVLTAIDGAPAPALVLYSGVDDNIVPPAALADTGLDPFAFQQSAFGPPIVPPVPTTPGFDPQALLLSILAQSSPERTPGDVVTGRAGADSDNVFDNPFADPYALLADTGLADLVPAAGGEACTLVAIPGGLRLGCPGGGLPGLAPSAGGQPGTPGGPALDPGLTLEELMNMWLFNFGIEPEGPAPVPDQQAALTLPARPR